MTAALVALGSESLGVRDYAFGSPVRQHRAELLLLLGSAVVAPDAAESHDPAAPAAPPQRAPPCEPRRFTDRPDRLVVRFCCEPSHRHAVVPGQVVFDAEECAISAEWARRGGGSSPKLPVEVRDAIFDLKLTLGGRIDRQTLDHLPGPDAAESRHG